MYRMLLSLTLAFASVAIISAAEPAYVIPQKPDPPIAVDGDLGEWVEVPNALFIGRPEHATYKPHMWTGPEDLSGTVRMAWRQEGLFLAIEITDDVLSQTERGRAIWKGDHVEFYLDFTPYTEPNRRGFAEGQFQLSFSPGNFSTTGDPATDIAPEVYSHFPEAADVSSIQYAALRTKTGWTLEAMVPFAYLGITPRQNLPLAGEVALSDADSREASQETMVTIGMQPWVHARQRLALMALGNAAGEATLPPASIPISETLLLPAGTEGEVVFPTPEVPEGQHPYLFFKARIVARQPAGYTRGLKLTLNGTPVEGDRLTNRPIQSMRVSGREATSISPTGEMNVWYGPDFEASDKSDSYALLGGIKTHEWEFDLSGLLAEGDNTLHVQVLTDAGTSRDVEIGQMQLLVKAPPLPPPPKKPAPTGPIPTIEPQAECGTNYTVDQIDQARFAVTVSGRRFVIQSRFSAPDGRWHAGSAPAYSHSRRIEQKPEHIVIYDTFGNLTDQNVPIMQRHTCELGEDLKRAWVAGLSPASGNLTASNSSNPSVYGITAEAGIGLLPLNDEFQVHVTNSVLDGVLGLADNSFVLRPGAEYTAEWMVVPTAKPDFWSFVNSARRARDANFTLPHQFKFLSPGAFTDGWNDEVLKRAIENKGVHISCATIGATRYKGRVPHGTAFQTLDPAPYIELRQRIKRLCPEVKFSVYFHCFIDVLDEAPEKYSDARRLLSDGTHGDYGKMHMYIFNPTLENDFGRDIAGNVDVILDTIGADSVYWDEIAYSKYKYHYGEPWDGCSADIDSDTMQIARLKSAVSLISLPFQRRQIERIMARGPLVTNGMPQTRTHASYKYQAFTETGSISNCAQTLLYSPIALGDHLTERTIVDAYRWMLKALDYGCVYNWYSQRVFPEYPTLASYMFPITPMELHEGYIIGEERIVTKLSGLYGWGDASAHEVHVFDADGREVAHFDAPLRTVDGKTYTELRLAEDWSAAIIRHTR